MAPTVGLTGRVSSNLPIGAGLSSSAALEVAVALALGFEGGPTDLALLTQRAEQRASGVPSGIMDQLVIGAATEGSALFIDCGTLDHHPVPMPDDLDVVVVHSGESRTLAGSGYATRRAEVEAALTRDRRRPGDRLARPDRPRGGWRRSRIPSAVVGPAMRSPSTGGWPPSPLALAADDRPDAGPAHDREPRLAAGRLRGLHPDRRLHWSIGCGARPGVWGARMTGGGFGGCVVALTEPGALDEGWTVHPAAGASVRAT